MQDQRVGAAFRAVRLRRGWRQEDVAARASVSRSLVSLAERGHIASMPLSTLRSVAAALDMRIDTYVRWRGGELDRLLNAAHSALHESVVGALGSMPGWVLAPEVSFSIYGERGVIDILAYHAPSRSLLVIELKTAVVDVNELVGTIDRKRRLAGRIASERGWDAATVSAWVIVAAGSTNQRRIRAHRMMLRAAFPHDGHAIGSWLLRPSGSISGLSMWSHAIPRNTGPAHGQRARPPRC